MGNTTKAREVMLSKTSKYEEPYQYWILNQNKGESMRAIARKFGVDDTGLGNYIKKQKSAQSAHAITNAVEGIKNGLEVIKDLQESASPRDNQLAQKAIATLEDCYPQMKNIFASIQNRVLNALDRETQKMEAMGELDLTNIAKTQHILKTANDTNAFIPKTPLVAVQNNIQNNASQGGGTISGGSNEQGDREIKISYEIVYSSIEEKHEATQDNKSDITIEGEVIE